MSRFFANESDFHQCIIRNAASFPQQLRGKPHANVLFWAHELTLHDAGRGGGNGSADLLTVDDAGMVWLVEVKFNFSLESGQQVWRGQLARYRTALMTMPWTEVVRYTHHFLTGREITKPQVPFASSTPTLGQCIANWLMTVGSESIVSEALVSKIHESLRSGSFGIILVSDYASVSDCAEARYFAENIHSGPVAYAVIAPDDDGFHWQVKFHRDPNASTEQVAASAVASEFAATQIPQVDPTRLRQIVSPACRQLLDGIVYPQLQATGWNDARFRSKRSAFDALVPVDGSLLPLLVVGTSERDAKSLERTMKIEGGHTLKINPRFEAVLEYTGNIDFVNEFMKRFYRLGWRGRRRDNKHLRWGVTDVPAFELHASEAAMIYFPSPDLRDHCGRDGDESNLHQFFELFGKMVVAMPEARSRMAG